MQKQFFLKLYKFLKSKNDNIYEWTFKRLLKNNELGIDILGDLSNMCMFENDIELKSNIEKFASPSQTTNLSSGIVKWLDDNTNASRKAKNELNS